MLLINVGVDIEVLVVLAPRADGRHVYLPDREIQLPEIFTFPKL